MSVNTWKQSKRYFKPLTKNRGLKVGIDTFRCSNDVNVHFPKADLLSKAKTFIEGQQEIELNGSIFQNKYQCCGLFENTLFMYMCLPRAQEQKNIWTKAKAVQTFFLSSETS